MNLNRSLHQAALLERRENRLDQSLSKWTTTLRKYQNARLVVGLLFIAALLPFTVKSEATTELYVACAFLAILLVLVFLTRRIQRHARHLSELLQFTQRQRNRSLGLPSGRAWKSASETHTPYPLITDLGIMGPHSLWTLLDETLTESGQRRLLHWLSAPPAGADEIIHRQKTVQKLRSHTWFYTRLGLEANRRDLNLATEQIQELIKKPFVGKNFINLFALNVAAWVLTVGVILYSVITGTNFPTAFLIPFPLISIFSLGSVGGVFKDGTGLSVHLGALAPLFHSIEKRAQRDQTLAEICPNILHKSPAQAARKLEVALGFLGTQTNPLLHFLLNVLVPWTVTAVFFSERLRRQIEQSFPPCIEELAEFEVYGSLMIFDRYQTQTYPSFSSTPTLRCHQVYHPLLERRKAVANDFGFPEGKSLGLLTGSNMSGKSTFLRTLGLNQILANIGAPVFADDFVTMPLKIETCIEVSDSLRDGYSYFYAEVRRLRDILQAAAQGVPVLFLIDEIFRGTNNRERQIGSRAVIRTLAQEKNSLGFISTHDLELTSLEETSPRLLNLHFREDINDEGQMVFSYQLRNGPCPTTNALRIMAAEGIRVEEP